MMKALITSAETGEKRAETSPFSSRLIAIDPTATPTENKARNSVATCWLALNSFFTSGGNWLANMVPTAQKKEMHNIARSSRRTRIASRTSRMEARTTRSEEHTSELQSLMRNSYAVFCLKKKKHISDCRTINTSKT